MAARELHKAELEGIRKREREKREADKLDAELEDIRKREREKREADKLKDGSGSDSSGSSIKSDSGSESVRDTVTSDSVRSGSSSSYNSDMTALSMMRATATLRSLTIAVIERR